MTAERYALINEYALIHTVSNVRLITREYGMDRHRTLEDSVSILQ